MAPSNKPNILTSAWSGRVWTLTACCTCFALLLSWRMSTSDNLPATRSFLNLLSPVDQFHRECEELSSKLSINNVRVWFSTYVPAGTELNLTVNEPVIEDHFSCIEPGWGTPVPLVVNTDMCRVASVIQTSNTSEVSTETWLPRSWTGRFLSTGNGALGGCIQHEDLAYGVELGFASSSGNAGHNGTSGLSFYKNEESLADYGYRSVHLNAVIGKEIAKALYGRPVSKAYFYGCSSGGRQAWKEAQDFPDDFDGILSAAGALGLNGLFAWFANQRMITGSPESPSFIPASMWLTIHRSILDQCDQLDGARDGILESPQMCNYDPSVLLCDSDAQVYGACLTTEQVDTVRRIQSDVVSGDQSLVAPRMQPGSELEALSWGTLSGTTHPIVNDWFRYAVYNDPQWDGGDFDLKDYEYARKRDPGNAHTWSGNLTAFAARGSKVLAYHGSQDGMIPSGIASLYHDHVLQEMGLSVSELDGFYRLFMISGMNHCSTGPGAWYIGQPGFHPIVRDPEHNALLALVQWVENGVPPQVLTGTKYEDDDIGSTVAFERRHCKYPLRNEFQGGVVADPDSWKCVQ